MLRVSQNLIKNTCRTVSNATSLAIDNFIHENVSDHQIEYLKEPCIAVDENDKIIGSISKADCHQKDTVTLHRAFSVFIFNPQKELLLQQRSPTKITFPNRWTNACCSHPMYTPEETIEEDAIGIKRASIRKLEHELGISQDSYGLSDFNFVGRYLYAADSDEYWCEHELDYVLILKDFNGKLSINSDEVKATKFVNQKDLDKLFKSNPETFSPWFYLLYSQGWISKWWNNLDDLSKVTGKISEITKLN